MQCFCLQNHIVERMWCEINLRINYPIKAVLVELTEAGDINIDDPLHLFCVSWVTIKVAFVGVTLFVKSWNNHPIPGNYRREKAQQLRGWQFVYGIHAVLLAIAVRYTLMKQLFCCF